MSFFLISSTLLRSGTKVYEPKMVNSSGFNLSNYVVESLTKTLQFLKVEFCLHITEFRIYVHSGKNWNTYGYARSGTETGLPLEYWTSSLIEDGP
jgi:hypothetical protein